MRKITRSILLFVFVVLTVGIAAFLPCPSFACSCSLSPELQVAIFPPKGKLPQNSRGLVMWGRTYRNDYYVTRNPKIQIKNSKGTEVPIEIEHITQGEALGIQGKSVNLWVIRPKGGFKLGEIYTFINHEMSSPNQHLLT